MENDEQDASQEAAYHQDQVERYRTTCEAINRCAKAGADLDALKTLCRETGVDIKHTILGDEIRPR